MRQRPSSEDASQPAGLQAGLFEQLGEPQEGWERTPGINAERQAFDVFRSSHPERYCQSLLWELDFDMLAAVEVIAASHGQLLGMEGVQRVVDRDGARVAGIITAGLKA